MVALCKRIAESNAFQYFILGVILAAAILVGVETYGEFAHRHHTTLHFLDKLVLWIFTAEAAIKMLQHGKKFYRYFLDPWNVFDFLIVAVCFLPLDASYAAVLRLVRILRALRLLTAMPQLQVLVGALIKSIPSLGYVGILLSLNFYVYAVMGVFIFGHNDPVHFHDLPTAMLSLFRVVTLEDWTDVMYIQMYGSDVYSYANTTGIEAIPKAMPIVGALYFVSFVMFGTMIMLNLFIGVILNSMDEVQAETAKSRMEESGQSPQEILRDQVESIEDQIEKLHKSLGVLKSELKGLGVTS